MALRITKTFAEGFRKTGPRYCSYTACGGLALDVCTVQIATIGVESVDMAANGLQNVVNFGRIRNA